MKKQYDLRCNIAQTLNLIGDRWTLLILHAVQEGCSTYKELQECLDGIPTNLLSGRLKSLCEDELLQCELYSSHPPRYRYALTEKSADLRDVFNALLIWGDKHLDTSYKCLKHKGCNGTVKIIYQCEDCNRIINSDELFTEPHEG